MNVAEQPADARPIEPDVLDGDDRVHAEVELPAVLERENVVEDPIGVWKLHRRPDAHDQHLRKELQVALIEDGLGRRRPRGPPGAVEPDHDIRFRSGGRPRDATQLTPGGRSRRRSNRTQCENNRETCPHRGSPETFLMPGRISARADTPVTADIPCASIIGNSGGCLNANLSPAEVSFESRVECRRAAMRT